LQDYWNVIGIASDSRLM